MTSPQIIVVGSDSENLTDALATAGAAVTQIEGIATRPDLEEAGIIDADILVVTAIDQATVIPIAKDINPDVRVIVYADASLPAFVSGQTDIAMDPKLYSPELIAQELVA